MEADVNIGQKGASAGQNFEDHSSATGTDIHFHSQNSFNLFNQASAKLPIHGYEHASMLPRVSEVSSSQHSYI